jgi:hypothetical protein
MESTIHISRSLIEQNSELQLFFTVEEPCDFDPWNLHLEVLVLNECVKHTEGIHSFKLKLLSVTPLDVSVWFTTCGHGLT